MASASSFFNKPIIIDSWDRDDTYEGVYPSGARVKDAYFSPSEPDQASIKQDWRYLFKLPRGLYERNRGEFPWQFWCEIIAYRFGSLIGVQVPPAHIGISKKYKKGYDTYAALIEWFYDDKYEGYISGGQLMQARIDNYDRAKGKQHNLETILKIFEFEGYDSWVDHWAKVLTFDALIGNLDRHHDNWGLIGKKGLQENALLVTEASPAFDNGTALGYEILEENLQKFEKNAKIENYLNNSKARHHMNWSLMGSDKLRFYEFMCKFIKAFPKTSPIIEKLLSFTVQEVENELSPLVDVVSDQKFKLTQKRLDFMIKLIWGRKELLEKVLDL